MTRAKVSRLTEEMAALRQRPYVAAEERLVAELDRPLQTLGGHAVSWVGADSSLEEVPS